MRPFLLRFWLLWALLPGTAFADTNWGFVAVISPTSVLAERRLCYYDGRDIACDAAAGLVITSDTTYFPTLSAGSIGVGNLAASGYVSSPYISATRIDVSSEPITSVAGGGGNYIVSGSTSVSTSSGGSIKFATGGSQRAVIDSSGNVGIGTTNPASLLDVGGTSAAGNVWLGNTVGGSIFELKNANLANGSGNYASLNALGGSGLVVRWDGNVGIGTTEPTTKLDIIGAARIVAPVNNGLLIQESGGSSINSFFGPSGFGGLAVGTQSNHAMILFTNNAARMRIDSSGNVGIGTATPQSAFHIKQPGTDWSHGIKMEQNGANTNTWSIINGGDNRLYFGYSTTAGGTQASWVRIDSNGDLFVPGSAGSNCTIGNGTGATMCSSDARLKKDIRSIPSALDNISLLRGVTFHWKDPSKTVPEHMGVIAQEVERVFPQAVGEISDTRLGTAKTVDIAVLVAPLIEAVKELDARSKELKADNDNLRALHESDSAKIEALERRLGKLEATQR